ncbi:MAG: response regulator [Chitinivibrionia bacterium]|nr:response regulator [Chitinivibrionia bacterium]
MNRLLFVDTSPKNLEAYKTLFAKKTSEWECRFADNLKAAFDEMSKVEFNMIVCDIKMPVLNGVSILDTVAQMYPHIIRVVLVPSLSADFPKHLVKYAHRVLVRPESCQKLEDTLIRIYELYKTIMRPQAIKYIEGIETIPSLPKVYSDLIAELESPSPSVKKAASLISADIGMSASILKMVNSAYFGLSQRITSPEFAVSLLGLDIVQGLVLTAHLFTSFSNAEAKLLHLEDIVDHCLITGFLAKEIAKHENLPLANSDIYIAGILHDIGKLIFVSHSPKLYKQVIDAAQDKKIPFYDAEDEMFGATHAEVGAYLLGQWGLSETIVELIAYHHSATNPKHLDMELSILKAANIFAREVLPMEELNPCDLSDKIFAASPLMTTKRDEWYAIAMKAITESSMKI